MPSKQATLIRICDKLTAENKDLKRRLSAQYKRAKAAEGQIDTYVAEEEISSGLLEDAKREAQNLKAALDLCNDLFRRTFVMLENSLQIQNDK